MIEFAEEQDFDGPAPSVDPGWEKRERERERVNVRSLALQLAHDNTDEPKEVVRRATAYLDFLDGKVTLTPTLVQT